MLYPRTLKSTGNASKYGTELRIQAQDVADPEESPNPIRQRKSTQKEKNQLSRKPSFIINNTILYGHFHYKLNLKKKGFYKQNRYVNSTVKFRQFPCLNTTITYVNTQYFK